MAIQRGGGDAQCPFEAAVCGLSALLSVGTRRGHADVAARWCMHALCATESRRTSSHGDDRGSGATAGTHAPARPCGAAACVPASIAGISDTRVHERLWRALLRHAAANAALPRRTEEGDAVDVLGMLWRNGTARALPQAQHAAFLLQLQTRPVGSPMPPQAQLALLQARPPRSSSSLPLVLLPPLP